MVRRDGQRMLCADVETGGFHSLGVGENNLFSDRYRQGGRKEQKGEQYV